MPLKRTNVYADADDLAIIKAAASHRGVPEAQIIREAIHLAALTHRTWNEPFVSRRFSGPGQAPGVVDEAADALRWRVFGERMLYDNRWVRLVQVEVEPPNGHRFWHHVVRLQTVAKAVVLDDQDRVLMLWRHRFVTDEFAWELPGGIVDDEDGPAAAAREVTEETGWRPTGEPKHLVSFQPMPGMIDTPHEVYLVRGAEHVGDPTDKEEVGRVAWIPVHDLPALLQSGQIAGSGSLVGLLYFLALRRSQD